MTLVGLGAFFGFSSISFPPLPLSLDHFMSASPVVVVILFRIPILLHHAFSRRPDVVACHGLDKIFGSSPREGESASGP